MVSKNNESINLDNFNVFIKGMFVLSQNVQQLKENVLFRICY